MYQKVKELNESINSKWPMPQFVMLISWAVLIVCSLTLVNQNMLALINSSSWSRILTVLVVQSVGWALLFSIKPSLKNAKTK